jgi:hypothetical protein
MQTGFGTPMNQLSPLSFTYYGSSHTSGSQGFQTTQHKQPPSPAQPQPEEKPDILREGAIRYWGYVNEGFESLKDIFRAIGGQKRANDWVRWSYGFVDKYVYIDAFDKGIRGYQSAAKEGQNKGGRLFGAAEQALDAGLFQTAASLYLPALIVSIFRDISKVATLGMLGDPDGVRGLMTEFRHDLRTTNGYEQFLAKIKVRLGERLVKFRPFQNRMNRGLRNPQGFAGKYLGKGLPIIASLLLIPMLIRPIDRLVNTALDLTYRPAAKRLKKLLFPSHAPMRRQTQAPQTANSLMLQRGTLNKHFAQYR